MKNKSMGLGTWLKWPGTCLTSTIGGDFSGAQLHLFFPPSLDLPTGHHGGSQLALHCRFGMQIVHKEHLGFCSSLCQLKTSYEDQAVLSSSSEQDLLAFRHPVLKIN
jgi:hypothetical protein